MLTPTMLTHLKVILLGAVVAALGFIAVSLGADPVFHADPIVGAIVGFVGTIIGAAIKLLNKAADDSFVRQSPTSITSSVGTTTPTDGPTPGL